jgi:hypothetical protein
MTPAPDRHALRDRFVEALLAAARPLQAGADPEVAVEALIDAAGELRARLREELAELRVEQPDLGYPRGRPSAGPGR